MAESIDYTESQLLGPYIVQFPIYKFHNCRPKKYFIYDFASPKAHQIQTIYSQKVAQYLKLMNVDLEIHWIYYHITSSKIHQIQNA